MKNSYSQFKQDLQVIEFYKEKRGGFFIEIGASDGIEISNTYLLETQYDWKGICVEPIPYRYEKLVVNRPNSKCSEKAVIGVSGLKLSFDIAKNGDGMSGISSYIIDKHRQQIDVNKEIITVETISFNDLLEQFEAPSFIEYLSLDTEGTELTILESLDFDSYKIGLIDVEHNYMEPKRTEIRNFLISKGYLFLRENYVDDTYCYNFTS
jgi:FkbM family methyltransferase